VMAVNFVGLRHTIETAVPQMPRGGAAVCISSSAGMGYQDQLQQILPLIETPDHRTAMEWVTKHQDEFEAYIFSKMCTIAYVLRRGALLAKEHGIRLNCTSPGPTDTPMIPDFIQQAGEKLWAAYPKPIEDRYATPEEQGWPLAFLNSDAASYVSGENFCVDGGAASAMQQGTLVLDLAALLQQ
jgi:NAD(P)-dependent dehydrogenase (short-subunit alcohol dehydrogenase family)